MVITLQPDLETRLKEAAEHLNLSPDEYAAALIDCGLKQPHRATIDLLNQWQMDDATDDPSEAQRRREEAKTFMSSLSRSRRDMEGPQARALEK